MIDHQRLPVQAEKHKLDAPTSGPKGTSYRVAMDARHGVRIYRE